MASTKGWGGGGRSEGLPHFILGAAQGGAAAMAQASASAQRPPGRFECGQAAEGGADGGAEGAEDGRPGLVERR